MATSIGEKKWLEHVGTDLSFGLDQVGSKRTTKLRVERVTISKQRFKPNFQKNSSFHLLEEQDDTQDQT